MLEILFDFINDYSIINKMVKNNKFYDIKVYTLIS
jgi:hypothetical protein